MNNKLSKNIFLISFLPAIAYWYLEANYPIRVAVAGGIALSILEISFEKIVLKHVHTLSKFNFGLIVFLGSLSLLGEEGIWFKLQPCFTGIGISLFLSFRLLKGKGLMFEMMESMNSAKLPEAFIIKRLEVHIAILFGAYGIFMGFIAFKANTDTWIFFKTIGFYIVFAIFMVIEMIIMRRLINKNAKNQAKKEIFSRF